MANKLLSPGGARLRTAHGLLLTGVLLLGSWSSSFLAFLVTSGKGQSAQEFCGRRQCSQRASRGEPRPTALAAAATLSWMNPTTWGNPSSSPAEGLSQREWLRMYRTLGLAEDSTKQQVSRAVSRLRRKYAEDVPALERVEAANLWIMTKIMSQKEDAVRAKQQANRLRELGDSPKRLFQKYVAGYIPPNIRQMLETPTKMHFRWASGLLGFFALIGLCIPTQASNFVALSGAACMGLVYQRNRPEPVKDEMGNVGAVQKPNIKEMGATIALVVLSVGLGLGLSSLLTYCLGIDQGTCFCATTCLILWLVALFFKVYECFD
eukprot:TRINITY_DN70255_c0_g1_i1.p1 TRINITY_DN70255_c0_g1~~TRINITY_DN70255_c0_g1_i1.p1  ORF type:complete len:321 (-),score=61.14 TRINITY_DN70255_c0_g1_i1:140-1102(-)